MLTIEIGVNNEFNYGWLMFILGQERPGRNDPPHPMPTVLVQGVPIDWADAAGQGWDCAAETAAKGVRMADFRKAEEGMTRLGQMVVRGPVTDEERPDRPCRPGCRPIA